MGPEVYIAGLVAAISSLAGVVTVLYKTVIATKDGVIKDKEAQIVALQAALMSRDAKLYEALDTLGDAVRLVEAGERLPRSTEVRRRTGTAK